LNIYLSGQKAFGAATYELLKRLGHTIVGVSSPLFASDNKSHDRLRAAALADGISVLCAGQLRAETLPANVDLIVAAHSHDFIGKRTRLKSKLGAIGYHPSLLPLYRGRDAIRWQIKLRERVCGGTVFWLNDNIDGGDIAAQQHAFISPNDNGATLWRETLFPLGIRLFERTLIDIERGVIVAIPQDEALATWFPSIDRAPLFKPDLPQLGGISEYRVIKIGAALAEYHAGTVDL
jgi:methionyl-tRNA formyltransferase